MKITYFKGENTVSDNLEQIEGVNLKFKLSELQAVRDNHTFKSVHIASIEIENEKGEIAQYLLELHVDDKNRTGCRVTTKTGAQTTVEKVSKWFYSRFIDFGARREQERAKREERHKEFSKAVFGS